MNTLWTLTMIDKVTGWFEMTSITTKHADIISSKLEQSYLTKSKTHKPISAWNPL